jgi:hypothetical protein
MTELHRAGLLQRLSVDGVEVDMAATRDGPRAAIRGGCGPPLWSVRSGELQIQVEQHWNVIAERYDVKILCG